MHFSFRRSQTGVMNECPLVEVENIFESIIELNRTKFVMTWQDVFVIKLCISDTVYSFFACHI